MPLGVVALLRDCSGSLVQDKNVSSFFKRWRTHFMGLCGGFKKFQIRGGIVVLWP